MSMPFRFSEIERFVKPGQPGLYEIHMASGLLLKVGLAVDLSSRLRSHRASRQSGLKLRPGGDWSRPEDVGSKKSILAKHLYYDEAIAPGFDLKQESERRRFLEERCIITVRPTETREAARLIEERLEKTGKYRYVGSVKVRRVL
jgi:hypothetical protein